MNIAYPTPRKDKINPPKSARRAGTREVDTKPLMAWTLWSLLHLWRLIFKSMKKTIFFGLPLLGMILFSAPLTFYEDAKSLNAPNFNPVFNYQKDNLEAFNTRSRVEKITGLLPKLKNDDKVYFISQNSIGLEKYIFNYELLPIQSNYSCWSVGDRYDPGDVWTCPGDLPKFLQGYTYLAVFNADARFWVDNRNYFTESGLNQNFSIYKVSYIGGSLKLIQISP